ncbi:MAG: DUF1295 domain-containing protein [Thermoplasmatota archaeon]
MGFETLFWILVLAEIGLAPLVFLVLIFVSAPYGKHSRSGWGAKMDSRTAWALMELPAVAVIAAFPIFTGEIRIVPFLFLLMWEFHYIYRTFLFPVFMRGSRKNFPALLVFFAFSFNCLNGFINGSQIFLFDGRYTYGWLFTPFFVVGILLFISGFLLHFFSDRTIRELRRSGETGYDIPRGGAFNWISCPNYLGEIIQWTGWALMTFSMAGLAFALFSTANLVPRAISDHKWYNQHLEDYPKNRKALLPFVM